MKNILLTLTIFWGLSLSAQIDRVEPPNWWIGFKNNELQLLVKGEDISDYAPKIEYAGISIEKIHTAKSPTYLFHSSSYQHSKSHNIYSQKSD